MHHIPAAIHECRLARMQTGEPNVFTRVPIVRRPMPAVFADGESSRDRAAYDTDPAVETICDKNVAVRVHRNAMRPIQSRCACRAAIARKSTLTRSGNNVDDSGSRCDFPDAVVA